MDSRAVGPRPIHSFGYPGRVRMAEMSIYQRSATEEKLALSPEQKVILIVGPAGSGKTWMARRIESEAGWFHLSEDRVWDELPREPHTARAEVETKRSASVSCKWAAAKVVKRS
jgi:chloramphenicol 3-O-phosphotransferase